jgi:hypothetical protein
MPADYCAMDVTARARRSAISALEWSRWWHLQSDEERDAELAHYLATPRVQAVAVRQDPLSRVARVRRIQASWALTATLPAVTARCSVCRLPNNADEAPCGECRRVLAHHGPALDSLEFITAGTMGGLSYEAIAGWKKDEHAQRQRRRSDDGALDDVAVALSAYLEHHASDYVRTARCSQPYPPRPP